MARGVALKNLYPPESLPWLTYDSDFFLNTYTRHFTIFQISLALLNEFVFVEVKYIAFTNLVPPFFITWLVFY